MEDAPNKVVALFLGFCCRPLGMAGQLLAQQPRVYNPTTAILLVNKFCELSRSDFEA